MSTLRTNTLQDAAGGNSVPMETVAAGTAKAWVNFNGTGTVAIRAAFNVSSITDNGVGDYTVNFTNAMVDTNYASVISGNSSTSLDPSTLNAPVIYGQYGTKTTTAQRVITMYGPGDNAYDTAVINVAVFR